MKELSMQRLPRLGLAGLLLSAMVWGCGGAGGDRPALVPVSGRIVYNGQPVRNADVVFMADTAPQAATGKTDDQGRFELTTFGESGAPVGSHKVTVRIAGKSGPEVTDLEGDAYGQAMQSQIESSGDSPAGDSVIPSRYTDLNTTDLLVDVPPDGLEDKVIELQD